VSDLVKQRPRYAIVKAKAPRGADMRAGYAKLASRFPDAVQDWQDGLRLGWADRWLHVRPSGTEPIVRLIAEAPDTGQAEALVEAARATLPEGTVD
jgi:phosphomannomutase